MSIVISVCPFAAIITNQHTRIGSHKIAYSRLSLPDGLLCFSCSFGVPSRCMHSCFALGLSDGSFQPPLPLRQLVIGCACFRVHAASIMNFRRPGYERNWRSMVAVYQSDYLFTLSRASHFHGKLIIPRTPLHSSRIVSTPLPFPALGTVLPGGFTVSLLSQTPLSNRVHEVLLRHKLHVHRRYQPPVRNWLR